MDVTSPKASLRIFLSYSSEQLDLAEQIYQRLKNLGHRVFFDRTTLNPGREYDAAILKEIRSSDLMVFLISPHSIREGAYTRTELRYAQDVWRNPEGRVLPVLAVKTDFSLIPAYLTAITIFRPEGNIPAEVAAKVTDLASGWKPGDTLVDQLWRFQKLAELNQQLTVLDQQWEEDKRRYQIKVNDVPTVPSLVHVISLLIAGACSGVASFISDPFAVGVFRFASAACIIFAGFVYVGLKAYQAAEASYLAEREDVLGMINDVRTGKVTGDTLLPTSERASLLFRDV
jgi:hypothetical protein